MENDKNRASNKNRVHLDSDEERDLEAIRSNFSCAICLSITEDPSMPSCGHLFCSGCLMKWIETKEGHICPKCRRPFNPELVVHISNGYSSKYRTKSKFKRKILKPGISPQNMRFGNLIVYRKESQKPTFRSIFFSALLCFCVLKCIDSIMANF